MHWEEVDSEEIRAQKHFVLLPGKPGEQVELFSKLIKSHLVIDLLFNSLHCHSLWSVFWPLCLNLPVSFQFWIYIVCHLAISWAVFLFIAIKII